jgi:hypothetical protein
MATKRKLVGNAMRAATMLESHFAKLPAEQEKRARRELKELARTISGRAGRRVKRALRPGNPRVGH